jgi:uncharacterized membrane protein/protein-disulfide isomerase
MTSAPMSPLARKLLAVFAALGLGASCAAAWVHYHLLINPSYISFCDINATVTCRDAYSSRYGSIAGIPVAVGGVLFFALVLLLVWAGRARRRAADSAAAYIFTLSTIGLAVVLYLAYASFFVLKQVCPLCLTTYIAVIGVFVISGGANEVAMSALPRLARRDARAMATSPIALVAFLLYLGGAIVLVTLFPQAQPQTAASAPQKTPALTSDQRSDFERWWDLQPKVEMPFSKDGAKVLVVKFNDYQCPPCRRSYYDYGPILARHPDVKYLMRHFPLDPACNPAVNALVHPAACDAAAAAVMAQSKGTFDTLTAWFFAHQEELSPATVRTAAREVGGITDFDTEYPRAIEEVRAEAATGGRLGAHSTPTFLINGRRLDGELPVQYFEQILEIELKRAR